MAVSKDIVKKVKKYEALKQEADELYRELTELFADESLMGELCSCDDFGICERPSLGIVTPTGTGEYCKVLTRFEDSEWGNHYFPTEDSDEFVVVHYST